MRMFLSLQSQVNMPQYGSPHDEIENRAFEIVNGLFANALVRGLIRYIKAAIAGLEPSFLRDADIDTVAVTAERKNAISLLDGLRGIACLLVFNYHFIFTYTFQSDYGFGFSEENWHWHQLPYVHMLYSGHIMVDIFFVISGYVLSYKPLKLLRSQNWDQAFHTLASSTFRRSMRLYIPSVVGILCVFLAVRMGAYDFSTLIRFDGQTILGTNEEHPPIFDTWREQLYDVYCTIWALTDWWHWDFYYNNYNPHLWTIAIEFRSSMVLFLVLLALTRIKSRWRIGIAVWLSAMFLRWSRWDVMLFLGGMVMAELDMICGVWEGEKERLQEATDLEKQVSIPLDKRLLFWLYDCEPLWWIVLIVGGYLGSTPNRFPEFTPGYVYLLEWVPDDFIERDRLWQAIGALMMIWSIIHLKVLQKPFMTRFAQYFGRISYAFYIVHGPILHSFGYCLMATLFATVGRDTTFAYGVCFLIGWVVCLPVSICVADVFWRVVDIPSTRISRRIERALMT